MVVKCRQLNSADQKVVDFPFLLLLFARLFIYHQIYKNEENVKS